MKRLIGRFIFFIFGWKTDYKHDYNTDRCVMIAAPHTSNWDLLFAMATYWKFNVKAKFFIKDDWTKGLHGWFFKKMGAIGVTRGKKNNLVDFAVSLFNENKEFVLLVPAEATRKRVKKWKRGFYVIAKNANVPVALGYLDYKNKIAGVGGLVHLTDSFEDDMQKIEDFYANITAKYPENFNPKIY
jgi:1-acyl-sn-glycerol-3-phosphate acyltransferase